MPSFQTFSILLLLFELGGVRTAEGAEDRGVEAEAHLTMLAFQRVGCMLASSRVRFSSLRRGAVARNSSLAWIRREWRATALSSQGIELGI